MSPRRHISDVGRPQDGLAGGLQCYPLDAVCPAYLPADIQSWAHPRIHRSSLDRRRHRLAANRVINSLMLWLLLLLTAIPVNNDDAEETHASRTHTHSGDWKHQSMLRRRRHFPRHSCGIIASRSALLETVLLLSRSIRRAFQYSCDIAAIATV